MDRGVRNTLFQIAAFIAVVLGLFVSARLSNMDTGPSVEELRDLGFYTYDDPRSLSGFTLTDHRGDSVDVGLFQGQWSMVFFGFTFCPDICPTTMAQLGKAVTQLESPPQVVMVTVDPERDSPEALANYVPSFNDSFIGVTGEFDDIVTLATQVNAAFGKVPGAEPGTYTMDHSASIVVIDPEGRYAGFIKAPHSVDTIVTVARTLN